MKGKSLLLQLICWFMLVPVLAIAGESDLEKEVQSSLISSQQLLVTMTSKVRSGVAVKNEAEDLKALAAQVRVAHLLLQERFTVRSEQTSALPVSVANRQEQMVKRYQGVVEKYLNLIESLPPAEKIDTNNLLPLQTLLQGVLPSEQQPLLGTLPYRHLGTPARKPALTPVVVPAYQGGNGPVTPADSQGSVPAITPEIASLAQDLNWSPVRIYEWVQNNVATEWYWGSMKGAAETLRQKSGNDADQATLLVALLRAANFPARFVHGTIEFFPGMEKAANLTGLDTPDKIAAFLQKAGIPFEPVIAGGKIANFRIEHLWVEAEVPYSNYRGAVIDNLGKIWIPLDTSIKPGGFADAGGAELPADFPLRTFRDDYLATVQQTTPLERLRSAITTYLTDHASGLTYPDYLRQRTLLPQQLKLLPASPQFKEIAVVGEYAELPEALIHTVSFVASQSDGDELFTLTLPVAAVSNRKVALFYEAETIEDQQLIDGYGGLGNTPAYLVRLRPVLRIDGERMVVARQGLSMGDNYTLKVAFHSPQGSAEATAVHVVGNLVVLGIVAQQAVLPIERPVAEKDAEQLLFESALRYVDGWNAAEEEFAALLKVAYVRPLPTLVTVGGVLDVDWLLDTPHAIEWKGLFIDAGVRRVEVVAREPERERDFMRLSALQGSVLEHQIFEESFHAPSVSTAKVLALAREAGGDLLEIDSSNADAVLPALPLPENIRADIEAAVNQGLIVTLPASGAALHQWSGYGYRKENPKSGEAGYMLSGSIAGGMTAWSVDLWSDDLIARIVAGRLSSPYSEPPNPDPNAAVFIKKISATDLQSGTAGKPLPNQLQVQVLDYKHRPVEGAEVVFVVKAGGGFFAEGATQVSTVTDSRGIASVSLTLGRQIEQNPSYYAVPGKPYAQMVGSNLIDAYLASGTGLDLPFTEMAFPGPAVAPIAKIGDGDRSSVLSYAGPVLVFIGDAERNPVANLAIRFAAQAPEQNPAYPSCDPESTILDNRPAKLTLRNECVSSIMTYDECSAGTAVVETLSSSDGTAFAAAFLGGQPQSIYPITATILDATDPRGQPVATDHDVLLELYSDKHGGCADSYYELYVASLMDVDSDGRNITARQVNGSYPLRLKAYLIGKAAGAAYAVTEQASTQVDYYNWLTAEAKRGDYLGRATAQGDEIFEYTYHLPAQPGRNFIEYEASATAPNGKTFKESWWMSVIGVEVIQPVRLSVPVDSSGTALVDTLLSYQILPANYQAASAQILIYAGERLVSVLPTERSGVAFGALLKGFRFDLSLTYTAQIVLNNGYKSEIRGDKIPLDFEVYPAFQVDRQQVVSQFDPTVPAPVDGEYVDSYKVFDFTLNTPSSVKVVLRDAALNEIATLVSETSLAAGNHHFVVDFASLRRAGITIDAAPNFFVDLVKKESGGDLTWQVRYRGIVNERATTAKMLGQTMVHDVLIQDGSLNLSRDDVALKGRGPQLALVRSYNNQSSPAGFKPLGRGWSHSLDLRLNLLSTSNTAGHLPEWVEDVKGRIFTPAEYDQSPGHWTMVQVNGTLFKKVKNHWYAERSKHGRLEETADAFTFIAKDGSRYRYDLLRGTEILVSSITDRNGNQLSFLYDNLGRLEKVIDTVNRQLVFQYRSLVGVNDDNSDRLESVSGPDNIKVTYTYDDNGYLKEVTRGARSETYAYAREDGIANGEFNLVKTTDSNGHSFAYTYHLAGEVSSNLANFVKAFKSQDVIKSVAYPSDDEPAPVATFAYNVATANQRTVTDLRGNATIYTLNQVGNPLKIAEPLSKTTLMTWSIDEGKNDNVMTSRTDPLGNTTSYLYDTLGNVTTETDPYGHSIVTRWNQNFSLPEERTDRNNVVQRWNYDAKGNLNWQRDGDGKQSDYDYLPTGEVESLTDPRSNRTRYTYDQYGNPDTITGPEGSVTDVDYDVRGRKVAITDANGNKTTYAYDALDYPSKVTYPPLTLPAGSNNVKTTLYDAEGNLTSETDRVGLTLTYGYTPRNQVASIVRSSGGKKTFGYDANGNLTSESDWKGIATTHHYDALNRRDNTTNRLNDLMSMGYDLNGNLTSVTDYAGRITRYEYDKLNRQTKVIQPALPDQAAGEIVSTYYFEADPQSNLKTVSDAEGHITTFAYNGRYLRTKRTNALGDEFLWGYDDAGNLEKETDEEGRVTRYDSDKQNRRIAMYRPEGSTTRYQYDAAGNLRFVTDPNAKISETVFDVWNRPIQAITPADPLKYTTTTERDGEGREVKVIDGNDHSRSWKRDPRGLVLIATDAENQPTTYTYDLNGNVETMTNARDYLTRFGYDAEDRKLLTTAAEGEEEESISGVIEYDSVGNPLQVRDGNGHIRRSEYNVLNLPAKQYDPAPFAANFVEISYDKNGKPLTVKNRRGYATTTEFDELGRVTLVTDPEPFASQTIKTTYDKVGNVKTLKDKRGILTEHDYDDLNRLTKTRRAGVKLVSYEYDAAGNKIASVDAEDHRTEFSYTPRNLLDITTFKGVTPEATQDRDYDGVGNLTKLSDEEGKKTDFTYDAENRQRTVTFAEEKTEQKYDAVGNRVEVIKPKLNSRVMTYDGLNRLTSVGEGGLTTTYTYDANNNRLSQTDPNNHRVESTYDELGRQTTQIQRKGTGDLTVSFDRYDAEGNLTQRTDAMGQVFKYSYDELNRPTKTTYPDVATPFVRMQTIETTFDANNNVATVTETKSNVTDLTTNHYDDFDRLSSNTQRSMTIGYDYDKNGNRTQVETINGSTNYTFDGRNRLKTAVVGADITTYSYTPAGRVESVSYGNGATSATSYWPSNRIKTIDHTDRGGATIAHFDYEYDKNGNRTRQVEVQGTGSETVPVPLVTDYRYDDLDRMSSYSVSGSSGTRATTYTFLGYNRKTEWTTQDGVTIVSKSYSTDESDWLTSIIDRADPFHPVTISYDYDKNGNTLKKSDSRSPDAALEFSYDAANRLVQSRQGATLTGQYDYNAAGLRVRHYNSERGNIETFYDDGAVLEEYATGAGGGFLAHYRYGERLLSLATPTTTQYYHHDALGSTVDLTDQSGSVQTRYTLGPWGEITSQIGTSVNRMVFTGQEHDEQTGLIYFGARYYDPDTARFTTQDSYLGEVGTPPSLHRYLYAYANPTVYTDPSGNCVWDLCIGETLAVAALVGTITWEASVIADEVGGNKGFFDAASDIKHVSRGAAASGVVLSGGTMGLPATAGFVAAGGLLDVAHQTGVQGKSLDQVNLESVALSGGHAALGGGLLGPLASSANVYARGTAAASIGGLGAAGTYDGGSNIVEGVERGNYGQASFGVAEAALSAAGFRAAYKIAPKITTETPNVKTKIEDELAAIRGIGSNNRNNKSLHQQISGVKTFEGKPYEAMAHQEYSRSAIEAREYVNEGGMLYRIGKTGKSDAAEAHFWSIQHPYSPGYAARYGIPKANVLNADFIEAATIKPNGSFVTRSAPPFGVNPGGDIEVVVPKNSVELRSFSFGQKIPYTGN